MNEYCSNAAQSSLNDAKTDDTSQIDPLFTPNFRSANSLTTS